MHGSPSILPASALFFTSSSILRDELVLAKLTLALLLVNFIGVRFEGEVEIKASMSLLTLAFRLFSSFFFESFIIGC